MFGTADALIQIDMSEYMEKHTASRLGARLPAMWAMRKAASSAAGASSSVFRHPL